MNRVIALVAAVLFLIGFSCQALYARGGHGGGHGGHGGHGGGSHGGHGGSHGEHGGGYYHGGSGYIGFGSYAAYSSYGWYGNGPAGETYPDPWYYYDPTYDDRYLLPPEPIYPDLAPLEGPTADSASLSGEWVEVPGQWVDGIWVPPHNAWVPDKQ